MTTPKTGPITIDEFRQVWLAAVDGSYSRPFLDAGPGGGIEAFEQAWAQFRRVSQGVDVTTQAMYVFPWSGQSNPPASGGQKATVVLEVARTLLPNLPLVLSAGTLVEEQVVDWGVPEGVSALTGRRYALDADLVLEPGFQGPLPAGATAERVGYGYNNPAAGTLAVVDQPGTGFENVDATVRLVDYPSASPTSRSPTARVFLDSLDDADAFVPDHVGQYLLFTAGSNAGTVARIVGWTPPNLAVVPPTGGTVELELTQGVRSFSGHHSGTFRAGETLTLKNGGTTTGYGILQDATPAGADLVLLFRKTVGSAVTTVVGDVSGASATIDVMTVDLEYVAEVGTAAWRILDWVADWGLSTTNPAPPSGGLSAMLDALGKERGVLRAPGEDDDAYRPRVGTVADVVTPNAIRRAIERNLAGTVWYFREAGQASYPGFFFDHDALDYDMLQISVSGSPFVGMIDGERVTQTDPTTGWVATGHACVTRAAASSVPGPPGPPEFVGINHLSGTFVTGVPIVGRSSGVSVTPTAIAGGISAANLFRVVFDYLSMRAWFYVGVTPNDAGDPGFAYDDYPTGAYDGIGYPDFYDGRPWGAGARNLRLAAALDAARAGGVGFTVYQIAAPETAPPAS